MNYISTKQLVNTVSISDSANYTLSDLSSITTELWEMPVTLIGRWHHIFKHG